MFRKRKTFLYFCPHQDDELLTMGIDICTETKKRHDVHVILCTDGSKSSVRNILNNQKSCPKHTGTHMYHLSIPEFIQARDQEFTESCKSLGVKEANIHIPSDRDIDGSLSVEKAESIMKHYLSFYNEDVTICTISPNNGPSQHPDHKALGKAADNLLNKGIIKEVRFFIEPYHFAQIKDNPRLIPVYPTIKKATLQVKVAIKAAINSYSCWNPSKQRYAIGYHSVSTEFNNFLETMISYSFSKINPKTMRLFQRLCQQHKKWLKLQK